MQAHIRQKIDEMANAADVWLRGHNYRYIECNYVPPSLFTRFRKLNVLLRTFYRLCPFNLRRRLDILSAPLTPQACVAMLKAYALESDSDKTLVLLRRMTESLRSFHEAVGSDSYALRQGIRIAVNLYEDGADEPTPLNTVWFGEYLLDRHDTLSDGDRDIVAGICRYLVGNLGYIDHGEAGVYFRYGHNIKGIIYNASAVISSFLIRAGGALGQQEYIDLGVRGLKYIAACQNDDGSWFYYGPPHRRAIDGFHQSYILRAFMDARPIIGIRFDDTIEKGTAYYRSQFEHKGRYIIPRRYDPRYNPRNTWCFQRVDGRDITEALTFFSVYEPDEKMVEGIVEYMFDKIYDKKHQRLAPEIFIYGRNRNDYIEFYGWYLFALNLLKHRWS